jgi:hypothetical protein
VAAERHKTHVVAQNYMPLIIAEEKLLVWSEKRLERQAAITPHVTLWETFSSPPKSFRKGVTFSDCIFTTPWPLKKDECEENMMTS